MNSNINLKFGKNLPQQTDREYRPLFFHLKVDDEVKRLESLLSTNSHIQIHDQIQSQCEELVKIRNPSKQLSADEKKHLASEMIGENSDSFGVWVFYPWSSKLVHILDKDDFIELRTSRNQLKITKKEQQSLQTRKIGIIGLSVGKTIASTIAIERIAGELRLADFDDLELSNMNRLNAGLHELGTLKVIIAAREIAELDPFIKIIPYDEGIHEGNIVEFLTYKGKLDILVEECDGLDVKILSRKHAKKFKIPVVMETNDRGMIDIERFDIEPDRPILHGLIDHLETDDLNKLRNLTNYEKLPYLSVMVGLENISKKLSDSLPEIGKTITTWPQLASSVMLGGALVADTCRRILLKEFEKSGRYYVDFSESVK